MDRRAPFIWTPAQAIDPEVAFNVLLRDGPRRREEGCNRWFLFRRAITLPSAPEEAPLAITVDGRYQLFVNGVRVGRGPARATPRFQRYDEHDIAPFLRAGDNVLAVLIHVYGVDTGWYETAKDYWQAYFGDGGLYVEGQAVCGGQIIALRSDAAWRCCQAEAWRADVPRAGWGQDFIEDFDARKFPADWAEVGFDDSAWDRVHCLVVEGSAQDRARGWGAATPFPALLARGFPALVERPLAPGRLVAVYGVTPAPELPLDRRLYEETLGEPPAGLVENADALLVDDETTTLVRTRPPEGDEPGCDIALLLAFDEIHTGYPVIELEARGGEIIELAAAETVPGEFSASPPPPRLARVTHLDCANLFRYTARPGRQRFEKFDWTAVRYMQITVRNAPRGLRIRHAGSVYTHYPLAFAGAFECDDDLLTRLWRIGRHTVLQCTHDAWSDGPGREKRQWLGDGIVHYLVGTAAFGPSSQPIDRRFLINAAESQRNDGLIEMFSPGDHHDYGIIIPDFSLHWVCAAGHYLRYTGDEETVFTIFPAIQKALAWFDLHIGRNGLLVDLPYWHFIEWAAVGRSGEAAIVNGLLVGALKAAAAIADVLGYGRAAGVYRRRARAIAAALNARHWNARRGLYVDCVDPETGAQGPAVSQHANAAMILWDIAPRQRWSEMVERMADRRALRLTAVPPIVNISEPFEAARHIARANTFFAHFVYDAFAHAGRFDLALGQIRDFYRPMIEAGATALWESFEPSASLCHAFSASPVYHLSAHALGVTPLEPGFGRFQLWPQPGDLRRARGTVATVRGDIEVAWERGDDDVMTLELVVPEGTAARIKPPPGYGMMEGGGELSPGTHHLRFTPRG